MTAERKKTVLRTIRLTPELDGLLQNDAKVNGLSVSGLIDRIIGKYAEWDRDSSRVAFDWLAGETFRSILNLVDDDELERTALSLGSSMSKAIAIFRVEKADLEGFLETISVFSKYSGLQTSEIVHGEKGFIITFHHNFGRKWSIFLKDLVCGFIRSISGTLPQADFAESSVVISCRMHQSSR